MRHVLTVLALLLATPAPAAAQSAQPAPSAKACAPRAATVGGIGRASIVSFTGKVYGERVCATVANFATDTFSAVVGTTAPDDALVSVAITPGTGARLTTGDGGILVVPSDAASAAAGDAVGPFAIAPGGDFPSFSDRSEQPRVVLMYAGGRVLLIRTSAVALLDLAHVLREQPALFGADAPERAVVLASGNDAVMAIRSDDGPFGSAVATPRVLSIIKRR